jgi:chromosome segregation ATPase
LAERDYEAAQLRRQLEGAQRQIATMQQTSEAASPQAQAENALLQERISDVASEIARLTAALEGPDSPVEALLADRTDTPAERQTLADRIRALQARASRVATAR